MGSIEPVSAVAFYGLLVLAVIITGALTFLCFVMRGDRDRRAADCAAQESLAQLANEKWIASRRALCLERRQLFDVMISVRSLIQGDISHSRTPSKGLVTLLAILWDHGVYDKRSLTVTPIFASVMVDHQYSLDREKVHPWERIMFALSRDEEPDWKDIVPFPH